MRIRPILTAGFALIAITLTGSTPTYADDFLWLGAVDNDWRNELNWFNTTTYSFPDGYPDGPDHNAFITIPGRVEIMADPAAGDCTPMRVCNLNVNNGEVRLETCMTVGCKLTIKPNASLNINHGGELVLTGNDVNHEIGGHLRLTAAGAILRIEGDATFDPFTQGGGDPMPGNVQGQNDAAKVQIKRGKTLTNNITFCGHMKIVSWPF